MGKWINHVNERDATVVSITAGLRPAKVQFTLEADTSEIDAALSELEFYVDHFSAEARSVLSESADTLMKFVCFESPVTVGTLATYPVKPSQWLLDLLAACRAGNFNWIIQNR